MKKPASILVPSSPNGFMLLELSFCGVLQHIFDLRILCMWFQAFESGQMFPMSCLTDRSNSAFELDSTR
jgi:hypothetical protein